VLVEVVKDSKVGTLMIYSLNFLAKKLVVEEAVHNLTSTSVEVLVVVVDSEDLILEEGLANNNKVVVVNRR
jgi:hypothetical protein